MNSVNIGTTTGIWWNPASKNHAKCHRNPSHNNIVNISALWWVEIFIPFVCGFTTIIIILCDGTIRLQTTHRSFSAIRTRRAICEPRHAKPARRFNPDGELRLKSEENFHRVCPALSNILSKSRRIRVCYRKSKYIIISTCVFEFRRYELL